MFKIKKPFTQPYIPAFIIFLLLLGVILSAVEYGLRSDFITSRLASPTIGSGHKNFDLKVIRLEALIKKTGPMDCIFLGSSTVNRGIDPEIFQLSYKQRTGKEIRCFNFGVAGLDMPSAEVLSGILTRKYRPKLLILGRLPGMDDLDADIESILMNSDWVQYNMGKFSLRGWLLEHSNAYRYAQRLRTWIHRPRLSKKISKTDSLIDNLGFTRGNELLSRTTPQQISRLESRLSSRYGNFEISPRHLEALEKILELRPEVEIVVVEMPVTSRFLSFFGKGKESRDQLIAEVGDMAKLHGVFFLTIDNLNLIPDEGWADYHHMNSTGADVFSRWLGRQIGEAVNRGLISAPRS